MAEIIHKTKTVSTTVESEPKKMKFDEPFEISGGTPMVIDIKEEPVDEEVEVIVFDDDDGAQTDENLMNRQTRNGEKYPNF